MKFLGSRPKRYIGVGFELDSIPRLFWDGSIEEEGLWVAVGIRAPGSEPVLQVESGTSLSRPAYKMIDWLLPDRNISPRKRWCTPR